MNIETLKNSIDDESIKIFKSIIKQRAYIEIIKPIILKCYEDAFYYTHPLGCKLNTRMCAGESMTIYNHDNLYQLDNKEFQNINFYDRAYKNFCKNGVKPSKKEFCPLLEAESVLRDLEILLVKHRLKKMPLLDVTFEMLIKSYKSYKYFLKINEDYLMNFV